MSGRIIKAAIPRIGAVGSSVLPKFSAHPSRAIAQSSVTSNAITGMSISNMRPAINLTLMRELFLIEINTKRSIPNNNRDGKVIKNITDLSIYPDKSIGSKPNMTPASAAAIVTTEQASASCLITLGL